MALLDFSGDTMIAKRVSTEEDLRWLSGAVASAASVEAAEYVEPLLEMTRQVFPQAQALQVSCQADAIDEGDWRIEYSVQASLSPGEAVRAIEAWYARLFEICPSTHAIYFRLALHVLA